MSERIVIVEEELENMIRVFKEAEREIREMQASLNLISQELSNAALVGQPGERLGTALSSTLNTSLEEIAEEMNSKREYVFRELEQHRLVSGKTSRSNYQN